jgi:hypothetical protein
MSNEKGDKKKEKPARKWYQILFGTQSAGFLALIDIVLIDFKFKRNLKKMESNYKKIMEMK